MQTLKVVRSGRISEPAVRYTSTTAVIDLLFKELSCLDREHFMVLHLDIKKQLIGKETISIGSLTQAIIHPREVFKGAVLNGSHSLILVHNHPSGDPAPSLEDIGMTSRLRQTGAVLGIDILDHIIIGNRGYYSFIAAETVDKLLKKQKGELKK